MHKFLQRVRRDQKGFTLIELMVVVTIIGLLAAFAVPRLFEAINKAKGAPGNADLKTIGDAMERFYLEPANTSYPTGTAVQVMGALRGTFLKNDTSFENGFQRGYAYLTDANGTGYMLIDPGANDTITVDCDGAAPADYTVNNLDTGFQVLATVDPADFANAVLPNCTVAPASARMITH